MHMPPCGRTIWTTGKLHFLALQPPCYILPRILCLGTPLLIRTNNQLLAYMNVFVDDFIGLDQGLTHQLRHVRRTIFHDLDKVSRPLEKLDLTQAKEFLSLKKLDAGDCSKSICQVLLSWIMETVNMSL